MGLHSIRNSRQTSGPPDITCQPTIRGSLVERGRVPTWCNRPSGTRTRREFRFRCEKQSGSGRRQRRLVGRTPSRTLPCGPANSKVLPSKLTSRHARYHAPLVRAVAIGLTRTSCHCFSSSERIRFRAGEIPARPITLLVNEGPVNHGTPSHRQRSTSRQDECL